MSFDTMSHDYEEQEADAHFTAQRSLTCLHCDARLELENDVLVDALSGDLGGTYDYCPVNPTHQHQAAAR